MKPHLEYAHLYWERIVRPGSVVIDATVGNGNDTLYLARLLKGEGKLIGYDIQSQAIEQTKKRLEELSEEQAKIVILKLQSHAGFEEEFAQLIVYNLGYLPRGDKSLTTKRDTTLQSIQCALNILTCDGAISITCYSGHPEGAREEDAIVAYLKNLSSKRWVI